VRRRDLPVDEATKPELDLVDPRGGKGGGEPPFDSGFLGRDRRHQREKGQKKSKGVDSSTFALAGDEPYTKVPRTTLPIVGAQGRPRRQKGLGCGSLSEGTFSKEEMARLR